MKFISIKEYFYKLYNIGYVSTLVSLSLFIYFYLQSGKIEHLVKDADDILLAQTVFSMIAVAFLTIVHWSIKRKMKKLVGEPSLAKKMDRYFVLALWRMGAGLLASLWMALGFFLTGSEVFSFLFMAILLWLSVQWPSPGKMCSDLSLKGDAREMILYKRDNLGM